MGSFFILKMIMNVKQRRKDISQGKPKDLEGNPAHFNFVIKQIPHGLTWERTRAVRLWQLNA
jgi:hypothetical protein